MQYNFDRVINRKGTDSVKYDLNGPMFGNEDVLPMWVADMDFEVPDFIREAIAERVSHPIYGYTYRPKRFYEALATWIHRRHGWEIRANTINFSPGIVPALNLCVMGMTEPGDKIVVQPPVYFPFFSAVTNHNRELVYNQLVKHNGQYHMDFDRLEEQFRSGIKMFFFCHPHNPVGRVWGREELEKLANLCVRYNVLVISDEVHSDLILFGNKHIPLASLGDEISDLTITCVAPSKTFNLAGLYTSAVIIPNPELYKKYSRILDVVHVGGGGLFGQVAMEAAYTHGDDWLDQLIVYLEKNFEVLSKLVQISVPEIVISPLQATYLAWIDFSFLEKDESELKEFVIHQAGLGLNDGPMFGPGGEQHQRMNIATPREVLEEGVVRLTNAVEAAR